MDFFHLSKLLWLVFQPGNLMVVLLVAALVLERLRRRRAAHVLVAGVTVFSVAVLLLPVDQWLARPLEGRFPPTELPLCVDGILVLSGGEIPRISASRQQPTVLDAGRYAAVVALARRYPEAKLVVSGGSPAVVPGDGDESGTAAAYLEELGIPRSRLTLERESRNTWENLVNSKALVQPKPHDTWILVTRAMHMPRAMGIAREVGWPMRPWPTDYTTAPDGLPLSVNTTFPAALRKVDAALKEWIGLVAYRVTGRSAALFPAPQELTPQDRREANCS